MYLSIIFYIVFALTLSRLGKMEWVASTSHAKPTGTNSKTWTIYTLSLLAIFIILCGLRYRTGVDCESYVETLKTGMPQDSREGFELFFGWIVKGLKFLGANRFVFLGTLAALEIIPFYYALRTRKYLYQFIGLLLILGPFFIFWMNGIRQTIAACFFVLAATYFFDGGKKGKLKAVIITLLAAQFHTSAYVLLILFFIPVKDYFRNRYLLMGILLTCAVIGQTEFFNTYLEKFVGIESEGAYESYLKRFDYYIELESTMGYGPRRLSLLIVSLITLWFSSDMKEHFKKDPFFLFSFNMFLLHACLNDNLMSNVYYLFRRPFYYTQPFQMICFAYLLYYLKFYNKSKNKEVVYWVTMVIACTYMVIECLAVAGNSNETSLYKLYLGQ